MTIYKDQLLGEKFDQRRDNIFLQISNPRIIYQDLAFLHPKLTVKTGIELAIK